MACRLTATALAGFSGEEAGRTGLEAETQRHGQLTGGVLEVLVHVLGDAVCVFQAGEDVEEVKELGLELGVDGRPLHALGQPPVGLEEHRLLVGHARHDVATDIADV